ncbi:ATP synthase subunit H [Kluyveromyces marxianus]|uniref:ATP synthase subunit H n=2 Tax=Kluyveromyces marxianus TaxID=4911 RepID=W0TFB3_KLUMD|nr:ATP synthase subunit H [Kluyveromyces marxianus DMKU3-1042]QGN16517.1 ATP synthase subunit H [Kluyveromyces marxianus]BAO40789.1 ATP synthase subunit H [Kluyveromyces marxianus DMKU3-1042]BAP72260.1 ATP synthase subunit H [Kluyveromyces marxianus]
MFRAVPLTLRASRGFSTSLIRRNVIQDLYLKELKSVNLKPVTAADAQGAVKPWTAPAAPKIPELELQSADALKEYAAADVETVKEATEQANEVEEGDWLVLEEIEDDHHH